MRIVHLTDLHYLGPIDPRGLASKRLLGLANLYLMGRSRRFGGPARARLIDDVLALRPGLVVITGDLTVLATAEEFAIARAAIAPLLDELPVIVLAGNHDRYTRGAHRSRRMEATFGPWMRGGRWDRGAGRWGAAADGDAPVRYLIDDVEVMILQTARPSPVSRGSLDGAELDRFERHLGGRDAARFGLLALHYPLLTAAGRPYVHPLRGLGGVERLLATLRAHRLGAVVHGHDHHWRLASIRCDDGRALPVINGGSSGLAPGGSRDPGYVVLETDGPALERLWRRRWSGDGYQGQPLDLPAPVDVR